MISSIGYILLPSLKLPKWLISTLVDMEVATFGHFGTLGFDGSHNVIYC